MANKKLIMVALLTMLPLLTGDSKIIFATIIGLALGFVLQRSKFCFAAAIRDYFLFGSTALIKTLLWTIIFTLIGFFVVQGISPTNSGLPVGSIKAIGLHIALGGILFGFGMTLGGGCLAVGLVRLGEGFYIYLLTYFFVLVGVFIAIISFPFWESFVINMPKVYLGNYLGRPTALLLSLSILFLSLGLVTRKERSFGELPEYVAATSDSSAAWKPMYTALALASLNSLILYVTGYPLRISNEFTHWISDVLFLSGTDPRIFPFFNIFSDSYFAKPYLTWESYILFGIIMGAFASAVYFKEFRPKAIRSKKQVAFAVVGGLFMGIGARLAMGCSAGALIGGIASMSLHGWIFALFLPLGVFAGVCILEKTV